MDLPFYGVYFKSHTLFHSFLFLEQAVIEAHIILPLIQLLQQAEFDIKKEAAWAISNATSGGSPEQIRCAFYVYFCI